MRRLLILLTAAGCATSHAVGDDDGGAPDGGTDAGPEQPVVPVRDCAVHFLYLPDATVSGVDVAGEWAWDQRTPMELGTDGAYTLDLDLDPGLWAYKLVVTHTDASVEWLLDPSNPYRTYDGGVENSGARAADCGRPLLEVASHQIVGAGAAVTRVRVARAAGGAALTDLRATLRHGGAELSATIGSLDADGIATVTLADLEPGKYTLAVDATDAAGADADTLLVPFWVEETPFDWRDAVIYMVMTDRFRNGDPSNDPGPSAGAEAAADYHGGDLRGVTQAIEDGTFDELGVGALWLSPFVENATTVASDDGHGVTAYHGYWPVRARTVDPRLGTEADLEAMVAAAHQHGIRVLMDYVINHVHQDHEYVATHPDWFRTGCICGTDGCDWTARRLDCSFREYLPDVDWQHRDAGEQLIQDALWWLERFDLDGLRVDAVKHVEDAAIFDLSTRIHERFEQGGTEYFLLGETAMGWSGDDLAANLEQYETIARYIAPFGLSGQFDFVLYHASAYRVWADDQKGMLHLDFWTRASLAHYPADAVMTPFVGSHDSERIISLAQYGSGSAIVHHKWESEGLPVAPTADEPYDRAAVALTWMLTVPGAPLLYYGDEYGEHGGADPDNRHMWKGPGARDSRQQAMYARVARAGHLRQELPALRRGGYQPLTVTEDVLTFARQDGDSVAIVAINRAGAARTLVVDVPAAVVGDGTLVDRLDPGGRTFALAGGAMTVTLEARSAAVLVRQ